MKLLDKILLAIDFRDSSENIVDSAIVLAKTFSSKIILIHVLTDNIHDSKLKLLLSEAVNKRLEVINDRIECEDIKTDKPILKFGSFDNEITQFANEINANMIMIGSAENHVNDAYKLGTTSRKIIEKSDKPVWVIKKDKILNVKNILCPVDFSAESKRALKNAITIARRFNAELIIFSVYKEVSLGTLKVTLNLEQENERLKSDHIHMLNKFLKGFNLTGLDWDKEIRKGEPATEILSAVKTYESDLLMMGTSGKSGLSRMIMGSVTEKVIREVPCSFATLKSKDIIDLQLETEIRDIESHFKVARQLFKDGFFNESINEYTVCLNINDMHIPSLNGIATVYERMGNKEHTEKYRNMAKNVLSRIWDRKIEAEIRKFYKF